MPTYHDIFIRLKAIQDSFEPDDRTWLQEDLDAFKPANFLTLQKLVRQCDDVDFLLPQDDDAILRQAEAESKKVTGDNLSFEQAQILLYAVKIKLRYEARRQTLASLNEDLFSTLKATNQNEEVLDRIWHIESQWQWKKHFAGLSPAGIALMEARLNKLNDYLKILEREADEFPPLLKERKDQLHQIAKDLKKLITEDQEQLKQAKLARLELVSDKTREELFASRTAPTKRFTFPADICAATLTALQELGLSSEYVNTFMRLTEGVRHKLTIDDVQKYRSTMEDESTRVQTSSFADDELEPSPLPKSKSQAVVIPSDAALLMQQEAQLNDLMAATIKTGNLTLEQRRQVVQLYQSVDIPTFRQRVSTFDPVPSFIATPAMWSSRLASEPAPAPSLLPPSRVVSQTRAESAPVGIRKKSESTEVRIGVYWPPAPRAPLASHAPQESDEEIKIKSAINMIAIYKEQTSGHNRQARADHLLKMLTMELRNWKNAYQNPDPHVQKNIYNNIIAKLFMHYQSIDNADSVLSRLLEESLSRLLGFSGGQSSQPDLREFEGKRTESAAQREELIGKMKVQYSRARSALFGSASANVKKFDPLSLFLRKHIIEHEPAIRDKLFVKKADGTEYAYQKTAEIIVGQLEEMDRLEAAYFRSPSMSQNAFDEIMLGSQALRAKDFKS